jgi:hypothetical protein
MNTVMNNNNNKAIMKETSKNCVSDYPLSKNSTESAERGVKRGILRNRNERCAVADVRSSKWNSKSKAKASRWFGKGGIIVTTADVDVPDKVLEKRIHLAEVRAKRKSKAFLLRGFLGIKNKSSETKWEKVYRSDVGFASAAAAGTGTCDRVVKVSFGRVECREFARTVGDNEVVGPVPLSLDWEVLGFMVASVDQYEDFRAPLRKSRKEDFLLATPEERIAVLEKCGVVTSQLYRLEGERIKRLKEEWSSYLGEMAWPGKEQGPQGVRQSLKRSGRTWSAIRRRISLKSARYNMFGLMKKLRVTLKRTGNVVDFLKTLREGRFPVKHVPEAKTAVSRGLEALILAQCDLPTTSALNLMMKWEKVVVEGESDAFAVCCTCILQNCVVSTVVIRV